MAADSIEKKKTRVSKNRKKAWRKHVNVKEIEEHLDEKRKDEITGGPAREKPDEELFFVDRPKEIELDVPSGKLNWKTKALRCFNALQPDSLVPPPIKPRSIRKRKTLSRPIEETGINKVKGLKKRLQALNNRKLCAVQKRETKFKYETFQTYDLWGSEELEVLGFKKIDPEMKEVHKDDIRIKPCQIPKTYLRKTSSLPAIEVPDPGASYNPAYDEYQDLILKAHEIELKKLKEQHKLQRSFTKFPRANTALAVDSWFQEMSQGIFENAAEEESEDGSTCGPLTINPPVRGDKRKPANKRRKEIARKKAEIEAKKIKMEALRESEIYRIRTFKAEIAMAEQKSQEKQVRRRAAERMKAKYFPATISQYKYEAPDVEVNLSSELTGSLRSLTTDGNLLLDRFKSFQRRNIIEPRIRQSKRRKYSLKKYVKRGHET